MNREKINALYAVDGDLQRLVADKSLVRQSLLATREGLRALRELGIPTVPWFFRINYD